MILLSFFLFILDKDHPMLAYNMTNSYLFDIIHAKAYIWLKFFQQSLSLKITEKCSRFMSRDFPTRIDIIIAVKVVNLETNHDGQ